MSFYLVENSGEFVEKADWAWGKPVDKLGKTGAKDKKCKAPRKSTVDKFCALEGDESVLIS